MRTSSFVLAVALLLWPNAARVIRSQVLTLSQRPFVEAARVTGASEWRIIFVHVAPNVLPLSFLYGSIAVGWAILTQASVSFLGFGDTGVISWGTMLQAADLQPADYRGDRFTDHPRDVTGDPDLLNLTRPDVVLDGHRRYLAAGADITSTNTFTSSNPAPRQRRGGRPTDVATPDA